MQKALPGINTKMLTKQLRALEEDGVIKRTVYLGIDESGKRSSEQPMLATALERECWRL